AGDRRRGTTAPRRSASLMEARRGGRGGHRHRPAAAGGAAAEGRTAEARAAGVSRTWAELLGDEAAGPQESAEAGGFFSRLRDSLGKSRRALTEQIAAGTFDAADDTAWERLEEALIAADVGVPSTAELVRRLEARGELSDLSDLSEALVEEGGALLGEPG